MALRDAGRSSIPNPTLWKRSDPTARREVWTMKQQNKVLKRRWCGANLWMERVEGCILHPHQLVGDWVAEVMNRS